MWAAKKGHDVLVKQLLSAGANWRIANQWQETALDLATRKGHESIIHALNVAQK